MSNYSLWFTTIGPHSQSALNLLYFHNCTLQLYIALHIVYCNTSHCNLCQKTPVSAARTPCFVRKEGQNQPNHIISWGTIYFEGKSIIHILEVHKPYLGSAFKIWSYNTICPKRTVGTKLVLIIHIFHLTDIFILPNIKICILVAVAINTTQRRVWAGRRRQIPLMK